MKRARATLGWLVGCCSLGCGPSNGTLEPCSTDGECGSGTCEAGRCITFDGSESESDGGTSSDGTETGSDDADASTTAETEGGCVVNSDCPLDARCGDAGRCIDLLSSRCTSVQWPSNGERDHVVFVGSILPSSLPGGTLAVPFRNAVQLAFEDFDESTVLQGERGIAWVDCDDSEGGEAAIAAAQHLVDQVGVPAIVGPFYDTAAVATTVTIPAGVLLMSPAASGDLVTRFEDQDLVWQTAADDAFQANATSDLLLELEPTRLLVLVQDTEHALAMAQVALDAMGAIPSVRVEVATYTDPLEFASEAEMLSAYGQTIAAAMGALPDTYVEPGDHYTHVVMFGGTEAATLLWSYLSNWSTMQIPDQPSPPMPRFYFTSNGVTALEHAVNSIGTDPSTLWFVDDQTVVLDHLQGVSSVVTDAANFEVFDIRYEARFPEQHALPTMSLAYDAMMSIQLVMATVPGDEEITGAALAAALPRLNDPDGLFVSFGEASPGFVGSARNALVLPGGSVDVQGISGALDWDEHGGVRADAQQSGLIDVGTPDAPTARLDVLRLYRLDPAPCSTRGMGSLVSAAPRAGHTVESARDRASPGASPPPRREIFWCHASQPRDGVSSTCTAVRTRSRVRVGGLRTANALPALRHDADCGQGWLRAARGRSGPS